MSGLPTDTGDRPWLVLGLAGLVLLVAAVPLFSVLVPPMGDYPNHLARMHILAQIDSSAALQANYVVRWVPSPYVAMDVIVPALARVVSVYTAGRLYLLLTFALMLLGAVLLHRALFDRWSAWPLLAALFLFNYVLDLGFINYVSGVAVGLVAFAIWVRSARWDERVRWAVSLAAAMSVYFSHYFAFAAYGVCVTTYELHAWWVAREFRLRPMARRAVVAGSQFVLPLVLFQSLDRAQGPTVTEYGTLAEQLRGLLAPVQFSGSRFDVAIAAFLVLGVGLGLATGRLQLAAAMRLPLGVLGVLMLAMPQTLSSVWGMQFRLPVVIAVLTVASLRPRLGSRLTVGVAGLATVLFLGHVGSIALSWQARGRQYDELRAALGDIERGARVLPFRVDAGTNPAIARGPFFSFSQMPAIVVIERDAFVPFLHKQPMMTVHAAPRTEVIATPHGHTIPLADVWEGADPVRGPAMLGTWDELGRRNFWGDWPRHFDYAVELHFGADARLPPALRLVHRGSFFSIHKIVVTPG